MNKFQAMTIGAVAVGALLLSGCGQQSPNGGADEKLVYASFGGTLQDAEISAFVEPYSESSGVKVASDGPVDYAKIRAQVESGAGGWDVVHSDPFFIAGNCGTLFEKLDPAVVTNLGGIDPALSASECELPHYRYGIILYYNEKTFGDNPPTSWRDFFDTERFPGKRGAWSYAQSGLLEAAVLADGTDPQQLYPLDLDRAFGKLDTIKADLVWAESPGQVSEQVLSDAVDMAIVYSGRAYDAAVEGAQWKAAWDAPTIVSYESVAVVKGVENRERAFELVNQFGDAASQAEFAQSIPYSPTNTSSKPELDELNTEYDVTSHDPAGQVVLDQSWWAENFDLTNDRWTAWQAG